MSAGSFRYPYTGDLYRAETPNRVRVDQGDIWGYFDADSRWLEGPLRSADPCFCRFVATHKILTQRADQHE